MVQGQTKPVYKNASYAQKDEAALKKSQYAFKSQDQKATSKVNNAASNKQDPWGKTFKNENHFKSLHIC